MYLLEDDREVFGMALLRMSPDNDVNTEDEELIAAALEDVMELTDAVNVKVGAEAYTVLPEKRAWVHQCWSGDVVNAQYYLPEGESIDNIGYWYPPDGGGVIGSDTIAVMRDAEKPVLAHTFINFLLDEAHALENYGWLGYQPPQNSIDPETRRRRRVRPGPPLVRGDQARGLRHRPPAPPAVARRREDVGQRLVDVQRRRLI